MPLLFGYRCSQKIGPKQQIVEPAECADRLLQGSRQAGPFQNEIESKGTFCKDLVFRQSCIGDLWQSDCLLPEIVSQAVIAVNLIDLIEHIYAT